MDDNNLGIIENDLLAGEMNPELEENFNEASGEQEIARLVYKFIMTGEPYLRLRIKNAVHDYWVLRAQERAQYLLKHNLYSFE